MKPFAITPILSICIACSSATSKNGTPNNISVQSDSMVQAEYNNEIKEEAIPLGVKALLKAYPTQIKGYKDKKIVFADGTTMQYDDCQKKTYLQRLDDSDVEDMFFTPYKVPNDKPAYLEDAGRSRCDNLFKKMYGASASQVQAQLTDVKWFGQTVKFSTTNGANKQLEKVAAEIGKYPELYKYMKSSGTFYWRKVRGAKRMSAHSYGIAFDIAVSYSDYWLWKKPNAKETDILEYANKIPRKIVEIFQKYGFIWGGSWYHFDTMHFEYRPELLVYSKLCLDN